MSKGRQWTIPGKGGISELKRYRTWTVPGVGGVAERIKKLFALLLLGVGN